MSDYWRNRRLQEREEKVIKEFYWFIRALIDKKPSPRIMLKQSMELIKEFEGIK